MINWLRQSRKAKLAVTVILFLAVVGGYLVASLNSEMTPGEFETTIDKLLDVAKQIAAVVMVLMAAIAAEDSAEKLGAKKKKK